MTADATTDRPFPYVDWHTIAELDGVELKESGSGPPMVFIPGMTGGGQATLELAVRVAQRAVDSGRPLRLLWVDYSVEAHDTIEALHDTVERLVRPALQGERAIIWSESLGCLVAPPPRFDTAFAARKRVMISAFGGVPQLPLRLGCVGMAVSPAPLYRWMMGPMGRWMFGPPGDRPDHVFFKAVAETPPAVARRRSAWLVGRRFDDWFEATTVPTKVWLGTNDRLVGIAHERALFQRLTTERPGFELAMVEGGGHVVTDRKLATAMLAEIYPWVVS
jgi:pimeloyl-ACP methyl ester carboxylesterase